MQEQFSAQFEQAVPINVLWTEGKDNLRSKDFDQNPGGIGAHRVIIGTI